MVSRLDDGPHEIIAWLDVLSGVEFFRSEFFTGPPPPEEKKFDNGHQNPYPVEHPQSGPPAWFARWWPVVLSVGGFIAGLLLLTYDVRQGSLTAIPAVVYLTLMGYLPISVISRYFMDKK